MELAPYTATRRDKVRAAMETLGQPSSRPTVTSGNRTIVRSWLNGLGFPTHTYESASLAQLQEAYHSFDAGKHALGLVPFVLAMKPTANNSEIAEVLCLAINRAQYFNREAPIYPVVEDVQGYIVLNNLSPQEQPTVPQSLPAAITGEPELWTTAKGTTSTVPVTTTTKKDSKPAAINEDAMKAVAALMEAISKPAVAELDEGKVIALIRKHAQATEIKIVTSDSERTIPTGLHHKVLPDVVKMLSAGVNIMLVGPAGSGKTTIADQAAKGLDVPFYFNGALSSEYKLSGFVDAQGRIVSTAFRRAYEQGGLYLFDEIDASMPDALLAFNAALANGHADFPDGAINRHPKFLCLAAANTYGRGADRMYVGRNQLDGASLDRFCVVNVDYDDKLERTLAGNDTWVDYVLKVRSAIFDLKIRHIVSPRASINGAKLLAAGMDRHFVEEATIWKGLDSDSKNKIRTKAGV